VSVLARCATLAVLIMASGRVEAAPADSFPLKFTALFGSEVQIGGIAVDADGNVLVAGTASAPLPVTAGAFQTDYKPATCISQAPQSQTKIFPCPVAFAAKLSHDGTALQYLTYLGTSQSTGSAIAVDRQGNAWIAGGVSSTDLPVIPGAVQMKLKGRQNAFLLELNPTGSRVLFATYLGGSSNEGVGSLALDSSGNAYIAGSTTSPDFPVTGGAFQTGFGQSLDGGDSSFLAKFDPAGGLLYSTFFHGGSSSGTNVNSIAADAGGKLYLTGSHRGGSLPTTPGAFQTSANGPDAAFVSKLDATGSKLVYSTYLAANYPTSGNRIAVDGQGNAYIAGGISLGSGSAPAAPSTFPTTPGAFQSNPPDFEAAGNLGVGFVTKLNAAGSALIYSTYLYASAGVGLNGLAVDASGTAVLAGGTYALDFPTTAGALRQCNPMATWGTTGVVLKLAPDGSRLLYSTYFGADPPNAIAIDGAGEVYLAGNSNAATTLPVVPGSFGWTGSGALVAGLDPAPLPSGSVSCVANAASRNAMVVAPGEIVEILGSAIGPATTVSAAASGGQIGTLLGGVQVLVNGVAAPLLSAGPNQIRAVIPFEVPDNGGAATIQIFNGAATIQPITAPLAALAPALFTADGSATGQLLMINEDGTLNSKSNPARQGSMVTVYATGLNNTQPALAPGTIAPAAAPLAVQSQLQIGSGGFGQSEIVYAGAAPGFVAGLTQINFRLPASIFHGIAGVYLTGPGSSISQTGMYFFLQ
jgi:uncharacterized protein (TIGR03437 family)